ncbi:unnamed protein product [Closterium sp. NIES-53]
MLVLAFVAGWGVTSPTAQLSFTLDSGASSCFFCDCTDLTPLHTLVTVALADPSMGSVVAHSTTTLPCPAAPSGFLTGDYTPSFFRNFVGVSHLHDLGVVTTFPLDEPVASCTDDATGAPLATFRKEQGSGLVTCSAPPLACAAMHSLRQGSATRCPSLLLVPPLYGSLIDPALGDLGPLPTPLQRKADGPTVLELWLLARGDAQCQCGLRLHFDRGGEFSSTRLETCCQVRGIIQSYTLPDLPHQNRVAERRIGLIMEVARTSMCHASAPQFLWPQAVCYANHQLNLWPSDVRPRVTPVSLWTGSPSVAADFSVRGSLAHVRAPRVNKLSPRTCACIFLGFPLDGSGWASYDLVTHKFFASQDVTFNESVCYYRSRPHRAPPSCSGTPLPSRPTPSGVSHVTPQSSPLQRPVPVVSGGVGGVVAQGEGTGDAGSGGVASRGAGGVGVEVTPVEDTAASSRRPRPVSPLVFPSVSQFPPRSSLLPVATEPRGVPAGGTGGTGGVGGVGAGFGGAGAGGTGTVAPTPRTVQLQTQQERVEEESRLQQEMVAQESRSQQEVPLQPQQERAKEEPQEQQQGRVPSQRMPGEAEQQRMRDLPDPAPTRLVRGPLPSPPVLLVGSLSSFPWTRRSPLSRAVSPKPRRSRYRADGPFHLVLRSRAPPPPILPQPPESSLTVFHDQLSDYLRASRPVVSRVFSTLVTHPTAPPLSVSALVTTVAGFASSHRLDYAAHLVSGPACFSSSGVAPVFPLEVLEDRHFELGFLAIAVPHLCAMLQAPEEDQDALDIPIPRTHAEAVSGPWASGMLLYKVKRPPGAPLVFKERYVVRGFSQREGVDIFQTFAPTPKMTTLSQRVHKLHSLDFSTAFLQGSLHEQIWLRRPPGFTDIFPPGTQWQLRRPVHGLRRAPREWHNMLCTNPALLDFFPSSADPSLFVRRGLTPFFVLVYVDDLVFATSDGRALAFVKEKMQRRHTCTDLGELQCYLGLQISRDRAARTITLTQSHMVKQILTRFRFPFSKVQPSPLAVDHGLKTPPSDEPIESSGPYPELVGCLMCLMTCTRPKLADPLSVLARFVALGKHRPSHWYATKRVVNYVASKSGMGLVLGGKQPITLTCFSDSS